MKVIETLNSLPFPDKTLVVALGNFDGVHIGHQYLLNEMVKYARKKTKMIPAVFLFHPHPQKVLNPDRVPKVLLDLERKVNLLEALGVGVVFITPFNQGMASLDPEIFIKEILVNKLRVAGIYVGFNYRFGRGAIGTPELLIYYGKKFNFSVTIIPPITVQGIPVSSTTIRDALEEGNIPWARQLLGYWPLIRGVIIRGNQRGRIFGFPTANVGVFSDLIIPRSGVYAGRAFLEGKDYAAVLNVGYRPTFGETEEKLIEVHLMGYQDFAYGKAIEVELYQRLRDEQKFENVQQLIQQIKKDVQKAAVICGSKGFL